MVAEKSCAVIVISAVLLLSQLSDGLFPGGSV